MEIPQLIKLNYHDTSTISTIKLNNDLVKLLLTDKPKLIVKNGKKFIKIKDFIYNLQESKEFLNLNIYEKVDEKNYNFQGNVSTKLTVGNEKVSIGEFNEVKEVEVKHNNKQEHKQQHDQHEDIPIGPYIINSKDEDVILQKFLSFMALGPTNIKKLASLNYDFSDYIGKYCSNFDQSPNNLHNDYFANGMKYSAENNLLLKDKIMKDLRPNNWGWVGKEKELMFENINNCLTRLGYSGSHPLRKRIFEKGSMPGLAIATPSVTASVTAPTSTSATTSSTSTSSTSASSIAPTSTAPTSTAPTSTASITSIKPKKKPALPKKLEKKIDTPNKRKRSDSDNTSPSSIEDFFIDEDLILNLQKKFDINYKEYKALYQYLKLTKRTNEVSQLTKLYELHNYCNEVKNQLIKISKEKRRRIK